MGLFDSIRRVVGGDDADDDDGNATTQPDVVDTHDLNEADLRERAAGVAGEVEVLDFSLDSLAKFDDAIDAGYDEELATSDTPGAYATDTVRFGCYLGEVLVRTYDGEWTRNPDWGVTITGPDDTTTVAVFDVAERSILTGAVFAAVADRAAVAVGLDGVSADSDADTSVADADAETDESTADPDLGVEDQPADGPSDDSQPADDSDSLIEEAEPEPASSESLFGDTAAETGPTVDDAPSAEDGPVTPPSESDGAPDSTDRDGGTAPEEDSGGGGSDSSAVAPDGTDPMAGDGLRATYAEAADELVSFWTEYDLDYTPDSLARLDALVSEEWDDDRFDDADFGSDDSFDDRVFTSVSTELGSYFGEVLIRELDAEWSDETATDGVVVEGAEGPLAIPVFKVAGTSIKQQPVFARSYDSLLSDLESDA